MASNGQLWTFQGNSGNTGPTRDKSSSVVPGPTQGGLNQLFTPPASNQQVPGVPKLRLSDPTGYTNDSNKRGKLDP